MPEVSLRVEVLGQVRAWLDDELTLGPARQRAVFAMLATRTGHPVSRGDLIEGVWGSAAPASAGGNVHTYVSGLRRVLEPGRSRWSSGDVLVSEAGGYRLRLAPANLDLHVFRDVREKALDRAEAGAHQEATGLLDTALALWRGEPFAGVPGPFAERQRAHLAEERLVAVESRARSLLALGEHAEVVAELSVLVREHPLRESVWESLILALYRDGRHAEALEGVTHIRNILRQELGTEPGPAIRLLHQRILAKDPTLDAPARPVTVPPPPTAAPLLSMAPTHALPEPFLERERETARLRGFVDDLVAGRGRTVLVEGEAGVGKSALLAAALADAGRRGCHVAWAVAEVPELDTRHVADLCASAPLLMVVDDLDRADVRGWQRIAAATRRLPLLVVATSRPAATLPAHDEPLRLGPLSPAAVDELLCHLLGARPGPRLRALAASAAGIPRCVRELVHALDGMLDGTDLPHDWSARDAPHSLVTAVSGRLSCLSPATRDVLRHAAVLGVEFTMTEVAAAMSTPPSELVDAFDEAMAATVVVERGTSLAFQHPVLRRALYDGVPVAQRASRHRRAAAALAGVGAPVERVAEQLASGARFDEEWIAEWLATHHERLAYRTPVLAAYLLTEVLDARAADDPHREELLVARIRVLDRLGQEPVQEARTVLAATTDPDRSAELRHLLARMSYRKGDTAAAIDLLDSNAAEDTPLLWRERRRRALADFRRGDLTDLDAAAARAVRALRTGVGRYETGHALQTLWLVHSIRRDHNAALWSVAEALAVVGDDPELTGMRFDLLANRMFSLQNLNRLDDADDALRSARALGRDSHGMQLSAAVQHYWRGRWDEALTELGSVTENGPAITFHGLREPAAARLLLHGVAALIRARRDHRAGAAAHLEAVHVAITDEEREASDFLLVARSLVAEQQGETSRAIDLMAPVLDPTYGQVMLRHQWLPDLTRLAMDADDLSTAHKAAELCADEASHEVVPARAAAAAARCRALLDDDPDTMLATAWLYRRVGRRPEMAATLEDAAVLLARADRTEEAKSALDEAVHEFTALRATWDLRRASTRLAQFGINQ